MFRTCPDIKEGLSECYFNRKDSSQALSVCVTYHLLLALGGPAVRQSCLAVGKHFGLNETGSTNIFEEITADKPEQAEEAEEASCHNDTSKDHTRYMEMKRYTTDLEALLLAAQLQTQTKGEVDCYLQDNVNESIKRVTDMSSTVGTHDAADVLMTFGHTQEEAALMYNSFGSFLKAASRGVYEPNKQRKYVAFVPHPVEVNLYHPALHANIIQSAYSSFKLSEQFLRKIDLAAEEERESCRQIMKIQDVANTHYRPVTSRSSHCRMFYNVSDSCGPMFYDV